MTKKAEEAKRRSVELETAVKASSNPPKPAAARKEGTGESTGRSFLERVADNVAKREESKLVAASAPPSHEADECTFAPAINAEARARRPRSVRAGHST